MASMSKARRPQSKKRATTKRSVLVSAAEAAGRTAGEVVGTAMTTVEAFVARARGQRHRSGTRKRAKGKSKPRSSAR